MGVDRDEDGVFHRDELDVGSDPANAARLPATPIRATSIALKHDDTVPIDASKRVLKLCTNPYQSIPSGGDPTAAVRPAAAPS
jgi:hypothetical protein